MAMVRVYEATVRKYVKFNIDVRKYFFSNLVIDKWNNLDQDTVDAPILNSFKNRLNKIRSTRMG